MININDYPDEIDFHIPGLEGPTKIAWDHERHSFTQLTFWCLVQRYWYYVCNEPQVSDQEYDEVEAFVLNMREEAEYLASITCPLTSVGSTRREDYPAFIRHYFALAGKGLPKGT